MNRVKATIMMLCSLAALAGCQREDKEGPLAIDGKVFVFNYRVAAANYVLTLKRLGPLPDEAYLEARFEDPRGGEALVKKTRIFPFWDKIPLESPDVHCIVKDRPYKVEIDVSDAAGKPLQTIETSMISTLDQTILPAKPLVVGAIYTANPDVYKPGQEPDFAPESCPGT